MTLTKVILKTTPVHQMQVVWVPQSVCDDIDRIVCNFVWEGGGEHGLYLVNWNLISRRIREGGLGFRQV